jgi:hypothetical protein
MRHHSDGAIEATQKIRPGQVVVEVRRADAGSHSEAAEQTLLGAAE